MLSDPVIVLFLFTIPDSGDAAVPRTPVADPAPTRTPHSFRFSAVLHTPVSHYNTDKCTLRYGINFNMFCLIELE